MSTAYSGAIYQEQFGVPEPTGGQAKGSSGSIPVATGSVLGGIKSSSSVLVDGTGIATIPGATTSVPGIMLSASTSFANLLTANPSPAVGDTARLGGGGVLIYTAGGWLGQLGLFSSYASLPALGAGGAAPGCIAIIPKLLGAGYCELRAVGSRWSVVPGQSIVSDPGASSAGYDLTAVSTAYVSLASTTIPAGMIGDGEEWATILYIKNNGVFVSGSDVGQTRIGTKVFSTGPTASSVNQVARGRGAFVRLGGVAVMMPSKGIEIYSNQTNADQSIDFTANQTLDVGILPGASTNTIRLRYWSFGRI